MRYKLWIFIAIGLFVIGLGAGLAIAIAKPAGIVGLISEELSAFKELGTALGPFKLTTAVFIFLKNVSALLVSFILSPILCLFPIMALALNGLLLSFVSAIVVEKESLGYLLAGILPHGIFEIPALIIGEAAALSFGATTIIALVFPKKRNQILSSLKKNLKYLLLALALLVPAAIIETFVTPLFLK